MYRRVDDLRRIRASESGQVGHDPGLQYRSWRAGRAVRQEQVDIIGSQDIADRDGDCIEAAADGGSKALALAELSLTGRRTRLCVADGGVECVSRTKVIE